MLPIELKQKIRDLLQARMDEEIKKARMHGWAAGIVIREQELEDFIDDIWLSLHKK